MTYSYIWHFPARKVAMKAKIAKSISCNNFPIHTSAKVKLVAGIGRRPKILRSGDLTFIQSKKQAVWEDGKMI